MECSLEGSEIPKSYVEGHIGYRLVGIEQEFGCALHSEKAQPLSEHESNLGAEEL